MTSLHRGIFRRDFSQRNLHLVLRENVLSALILLCVCATSLVLLTLAIFTAAVTTIDLFARTVRLRVAFLVVEKTGRASGLLGAADVLAVLVGELGVLGEDLIARLPALLVGLVGLEVDVDLLLAADHDGGVDAVRAQRLLAVELELDRAPVLAWEHGRDRLEVGPEHAEKTVELLLRCMLVLIFSDT